MTNVTQTVSASIDDVPEEITEAVVIDDTHTVTPSTELARRVTHEVIRPLAAADVVDAMRAHQDLLRQILDVSDWQGQPDTKGSFVKKSGWRKIALAYNLALGRVSEDVERDHDGSPRRATYTAWAEAPNGRRVESSGHCAFDESRFSGPRGNATKLENDMRATAETRAKNRAISDLIGMGKVSAEEVDAGAAAGALMPLPAEHKHIVFGALALLISPSMTPADAKDTKEVATTLVRIFDGVMPLKLGEALLAAAGRKQRLAESAPAGSDLPWSANYEPAEPVELEADIGVTVEAWVPVPPGEIDRIARFAKDVIKDGVATATMIRSLLVEAGATETGNLTAAVGSLSLQASADFEQAVHSLLDAQEAPVAS